MQDSKNLKSIFRDQLQRVSRCAGVAFLLCFGVTAANAQLILGSGAPGTGILVASSLPSVTVPDVRALDVENYAGVRVEWRFSQKQGSVGFPTTGTGASVIDNNGIAVPPAAVVSAIQPGLSGVLTACTTFQNNQPPALCTAIEYVGCPDPDIVLDRRSKSVSAVTNLTGIAGQTVNPPPSLQAFVDFYLYDGDYAAGNKASANVPVTWQIVSGNGSLLTPTTTTDGSGTASTQYVAGTQTPTQTLRATVTGVCTTSPPITRDFTITVTPAPTNGNPVVDIVNPSTAGSINVGSDLAVRVRASDPDANDRVVTVSLFARNTQDNTETQIGSLNRPSVGTEFYDFSWTPTVQGAYILRAEATDTQLGIGRSINQVRVDVVPREADKIEVTTPTTALTFKPGTLFKIALLATDSKGPVANQVIEWSIAKSAATSAASTKQAATASKATVNCAVDDQLPPQRTVTTGADGRAEISFTPGCAPEDRIFTFGVPGKATNSVTLRGPASQVSSIDVPVELQAQAIVALPGQPISVSITALNADKVPVSSVPITWRLTPVDAGALEVTAGSTDTAGVAATRVTLSANAIDPTLQACVTGQTTGCATFKLKNAQVFVAAPAAATVAAAQTHALAGARLQMSQLTTRFQQLRNEMGGGFDNGAGVTVNGGRVPLPGSGSTDADGVKRSKWGVFTLGDVDVTRTEDGTGGKTKISTKGLSVGVDYRAIPALTVGAAIGGLHGKTTIADNGSQKARGVSGAFFSQWFSPGQFYANAIGSYGRNSYDMSRVARDAARIESDTKSKQTGFQLEGGYNYSRDRFSVSPYVRYEHVRVELDGFNESVHPDAISVSASKMRANTFAFGLVGDARFSTSNGVWIPGLRVEYLNEKQKQGAAFARLINGTPLAVPVPVAPYDSSYGNVGLSLQWLTGIVGQPISVFVGFDSSFGKSGVSNRRFSAGVKIPL